MERLTRHLASIALAGAVLLGGGCAAGGGDEAASSPPGSAEPTSQAAASPTDSALDDQVVLLRQTSDAALAALAGQDYDGLADLIHPVEGVRFAPYGYIDVEQGVLLLPAQVAVLGADDTTYVWGADPGTGDPIKLTFAAYSEKYLYGQQFLQADEIAANRSLSGGSSTDNTAEVFGDAQFVDYHFRGFDEQYDGLDWETLRVVLRESAGRWYVVGLINDSWTP